jgi:hypothetical protein
LWYNNAMKKYLIAAILVGAFLVSSPALAQDNSALIAQLQAQIAQLLEQIRVLQNQQRPNQNHCYQFTRDLKAGDDSSDVFHLNELLETYGFHSYARYDSVFSNTVTLPAVIKFQTTYGIPATGYVGPLTRAKLNSLYGCGNAAGDLVLSGTFGPTSLAVGETGIWKIFVRNHANSSLRYQINWGDGPVAVDAQPSGLVGGSAATAHQEASFSHVYSQSGNYTISFTVSDTAGHQVNGTMSIIVRPQAGPGLKVLSPNGGENWVANSVQDIRWQTVAGAVPKVDLYLDRATPIYCFTTPCDNGYVLDNNIDINTTYHWIVATDITNRIIPAGDYRVRVCAAGSQTNCDSSDQSFAITPQYLPSSGSSTTHN